MEQAAEAFQLSGCKDNVLLQIEKGLLLTCSFSELVTVGGYTNPISTENPCRSWLASESGVSVNIFLAYEIAFAAVRRFDKPAPTGSPTLMR
jgi:hypothetical protein